MINSKEDKSIKEKLKNITEFNSKNYIIETNEENIKIKSKIICSDLKSCLNLFLDNDKPKFSPFTWSSIGLNLKKCIRVNLLFINLFNTDFIPCILHGIMRMTSLIINLSVSGNEELQKKLINNFQKHGLLKSLNFTEVKKEEENNYETDVIYNEKKRINFISGDQAHFIIDNFIELFDFIKDNDILLILYYLKIFFCLIYQNDVNFYKNENNLISIQCVISYLKNLIFNKYVSCRSSYVVIFDENIIDVICKLNELDLTLYDCDNSTVENKNKELKKSIVDLNLNNNIINYKNFLMNKINNIKDGEKQITNEEKKKIYIMSKTLIKQLRLIYLSFKTSDKEINFFEIPNFKKFFKKKNKIENNENKKKENENEIEKKENNENIVSEIVEFDLNNFKKRRIIPKNTIVKNLNLSKEIDEYQKEEFLKYNGKEKSEKKIKVEINNNGDNFKEIIIKKKLKKISENQKKTIEDLKKIFQIDLEKKILIKNDLQLKNYLNEIKVNLELKDSKDENLNKINNLILKKINKKINNNNNIIISVEETQKIGNMQIFQKENETFELKIGGNNNNFF